MKVKEFCKILNLDECGVNDIVVAVATKDRVTYQRMHESDFGYGEDYDRYKTVAEWLIGEYGDCEIMDDNYILNGCFVLSVRKEGKNG